MSRWKPGDAVTVREIWRGKIWTVRALTVVRDEPNLLALYQPAGAPWKRPYSRDGLPIRVPDQPWELRDDKLADDSLRLIIPGDAHSTLLIWREPWKLLRWYINLEEPFRRTPMGFDYMDQTLDIVVQPDMSSWRWKDEDEFEEAKAAEIFTPDEARAIHAEGKRALERLLARKSPFDERWENWRPDPAWRHPEITSDWDESET
jgi:predicted RNA-binding protein associated with RNAse of E/G family